MNANGGDGTYRTVNDKAKRSNLDEKQAWPKIKIGAIFIAPMLLMVLLYWIVTE